MTNHSDPMSPLAVQQPVRDANRNQRELGDRNASEGDVLLPSLEDGVTLLDVDGGRGVPVVHSLVLDHLLLNDGPAFWVDAHGYATTTTLSRLSPSQRLLDRIHVARGFTPYQHFGAVSDLPGAVRQAIREATRDDERRRGRVDDASSDELSPSVIVVPALDAQYRDDSLGSEAAETLQARVLARLVRYAEGYDCPVLVTRLQTDAFTDAIETLADHRLRCEQTALGPRFSGGDFETLVYPVGDGAYLQTTFAYWRQVLGARAVQAGVEPAVSSTSPRSTAGSIGYGLLADGSTAPLTTDPLLDVWSGDGRGWS